MPRKKRWYEKIETSFDDPMSMSEAKRRIKQGVKAAGYTLGKARKERLGWSAPIQGTGLSPAPRLDVSRRSDHWSIAVLSTAIASAHKSQKSVKLKGGRLYQPRIHGKVIHVLGPYFDAPARAMNAAAKDVIQDVEVLFKPRRGRRNPTRRIQGIARIARLYGLSEDDLIAFAREGKWSWGEIRDHTDEFIEAYQAPRSPPLDTPRHIPQFSPPGYSATEKAQWTPILSARSLNLLRRGRRRGRRNPYSGWGSSPVDPKVVLSEFLKDWEPPQVQRLPPKLRAVYDRDHRAAFLPLDYASPSEYARALTHNVADYERMAAGLSGSPMGFGGLQSVYEEFYPNFSPEELLALARVLKTASLHYRKLDNEFRWEVLARQRGKDFETQRMPAWARKGRKEYRVRVIGGAAEGSFRVRAQSERDAARKGVALFWEGYDYPGASDFEHEMWKQKSLEIRNATGAEVDFLAWEVTKVIVYDAGSRKALMSWGPSGQEKIYPGFPDWSPPSSDVFGLY